MLSPHLHNARSCDASASSQVNPTSSQARLIARSFLPHSHTYYEHRTTTASSQAERVCGTDVLYWTMMTMALSVSQKLLRLWFKQTLIVPSSYHHGHLLQDYAKSFRTDP